MNTWRSKFKEKGGIKREREEGRGERGTKEVMKKKKDNLPCYKVSKHVFYERHFPQRLVND